MNCQILFVMSGKYQATFFLMLIMVAVVTEANNIGRYPESSENADYVFGLARQSLANCPKCEDCPAPPVCPTCPSFVSNAGLSKCLVDSNFERTSAREGIISVSNILVDNKCNFAIVTVPPYTKLRIKCPTQTLGAGIVQATPLGQASVTVDATGVELPITSPAVLITADNKVANGAVKCSWYSE